MWISNLNVPMLYYNYINYLIDHFDNYYIINFFIGLYFIKYRINFINFEYIRQGYLNSINKFGLVNA
jgi:hypothetical protein